MNKRASTRNTLQSASPTPLAYVVVPNHTFHLAGVEYGRAVC